MKKIAMSIVCVMIASISNAQTQGFSEADMQNMMQVMQKMQECMAKVDQAALDELDQKSKEIDAELKTLCEKGKRDKAQKKAIAYSKEMLKNPALKQMRECGEMVKGMVPEGTMPSMAEDFDYSEDKGHVCDNLE